MLDLFTTWKGMKLIKTSPGSWLRWVNYDKHHITHYKLSHRWGLSFVLRCVFSVCRHFSGSVTRRRVICASWLVGFLWEFPSYEVQMRKGTGTARRLFLKCRVSCHRWLYLGRKSHPSFSCDFQPHRWGGSLSAFSAVLYIPNEIRIMLMSVKSCFCHGSQTCCMWTDLLTWHEKENILVCLLVSSLVKLQKKSQNELVLCFYLLIRIFLF